MKHRTILALALCALAAVCAAAFGQHASPPAKLPGLQAAAQVARDALDAYAAGVNAFVAALAQLPPEYRAPEVTRFAPWTALDSLTVAKSITFGLSFGLDDIETTIALQTYTAVFDPVLGPGIGRTLFSEDPWGSQPFYPASTVPDASATAAFASRRAADWGEGHASAAKLAQRHRELPFFKHRLDRDNRPGSNQ